jgi:hypothetical protein
MRGKTDDLFVFKIPHNNIIWARIYGEISPKKKPTFYKAGF